MLHVRCDFILWFCCGLSEVGVLKDHQSLKVAQSGKNAEEELATFRFSWIWWCWGMKAEGIKVSGLVNWWTYECGIWRKRPGWGRRKVWTGYMKGVGWELSCNTEIGVLDASLVQSGGSHNPYPLGACGLEGFVSTALLWGHRTTVSHPVSQALFIQVK